MPGIFFHFARGIVLSENIKRKNLSTVEKIEAYAMWIDYTMLSSPNYLPAFESAKKIDINNPLQRISWLMMKLHSDDRMKTDYYSNKFIRILEKAMRGLPEPVEWQSFYINDLKEFLNTDEGKHLNAGQWACMAAEAEGIYEMLRDAAEERKKATQAKKGEKIGEHQGAKVVQLIAPPIDPEDNKTRTIIAKTFNTKRDKQVFDMWLACYSQQEIADKAGIDRTSVSNIIEDFRKNGESAEIPNPHEYDPKNPEHKIKMYDVWRRLNDYY